MQLIHVEGLGKEGIRSTLQSFEAVGDIALRSKHHNRNMADVHIRLDHPQHGEAVHLRHHHIAYHKIKLAIRLSREQLSQCLTAIGDCRYMVVVTKFLSNIVADLDVVIHHQHLIARLGFLPLSLFLFFWYQDLLCREVSLTQGKMYGKHTALSIVTVSRLYRTMMHFHHHLTEVQANTSSFDMKGMGGTIEAVE